MVNSSIECWFMFNEYTGLWHTWQLHWVKLLRLYNFSHDMKPSFHLQQMSQPVIDFLLGILPLIMNFLSSTPRAESSFLWSTNDFNKRYSLPLTSHWACIDSAMMLAANSVISLKLEIQPNEGMCPWWDSDGITIGILLLTNHWASGHLASFREQYFCIYILPFHLEVIYGFSSRLGNISPFCEASSYGSCCGISSVQCWLRHLP